MSITVWNVPDTGHLKAHEICGCRFWIDHWRTYTGSQRKTCMVVGCNRPPRHGAHVRAYRARTVHIIGLCAWHNHPSRTDPFEVDARTYWAPDHYAPGCGVFPTLGPGDFVTVPRARDPVELLEVIEEYKTDSSLWWARTIGSTRRRKVLLDGETVRRL